MAKIFHNGESYDMNMGQFLIMKRAKEIVNELMNNPMLLQEFNKEMRYAKLKNINNKINNK